LQLALSLSYLLRRLQTFADDIGVLAREELCDVIVDDINYPFA